VKEIRETKPDDERKYKCPTCGHLEHKYWGWQDGIAFECKYCGYDFWISGWGL